MSSLKRKRLELGLSQQQLAKMLGITRSAVNMAERGERPLYPHLYDKLDELKASVTEPPAMDASLIAALDAYKAKCRADLEMKIKEKGHELKKAQFNLARMKEDYLLAEKSLRIICEEMQKLPSLNYYMKQIREMYKTTLKTLLQTCPEAQQKLELRIKVLSCFITEAQAVISK